MGDKIFSVPEIDAVFDEHQYLLLTDLLSAAAEMVGDGAGGDLGFNPEYERGMAELVMNFMGLNADHVPQITAAIHGYATDRSRA